MQNPIVRFFATVIAIPLMAVLAFGTVHILLVFVLSLLGYYDQVAPYDTY